jgi:hypothetical protein
MERRLSGWSGIMKTIEIAPTEWRDCLNAFTRAHRGGLVSVDVLGAELGVQPEVRSLPLVGIWDDPAGPDIMMAVASSGAEQLTHTVHAARYLAIERTDAGADAAVEIQSSDGTTTLMTFVAHAAGGSAAQD